MKYIHKNKRLKFSLSSFQTNSGSHKSGGSNPIFPLDTPKFGFGDEQKWEKSIWKERETNFLFLK